MYVLLDENLLSRTLKQPFLASEHIVKNVEDMGWRGVKDKELIALATTNRFDVFITADKNLPYEQNIKALALKVVVLDAKSTKPSALLPLVLTICGQLETLVTGSIALINDKGEITRFED